MDFLKKAGNFLGNAAYQAAKFVPGVGNVIRSYEQVSKNTNLARQQAANRYQQQNRPVPQQLRQAPQPRLNYNAAMSALNALKSGAGNVANFVAPNTTKFAGQALNTAQATQMRLNQISRQLTGQKIAPGDAGRIRQLEAGGFVPQNVRQGTATPLQFAGAAFKTGAPVGIEAASFGKGISTANLGIRQAAPALVKQGVAFGGAQTANNLAFGEGDFKQRLKNLPMDALNNVAGNVGGQFLGYGLGRAGTAISDRLRSPATNVGIAGMGLVQRPGSKVRIDPKTGKKVFAPQYNPTGAPVNNAGLQADNYNRNFAGKFSKKQASSEGSTRVISERELDIFNRTGKLPANPEGYTNIIKPGEIDNIKGITDSKKYLVKLKDGIKIDSESGPQYAVKGGIDGKYVAEIAPYVKSADRTPVLAKKFNSSLYADNAIGNDIPKSVADQLADAKKPRGFIKTVQNSPSSTAEVAAAVKGSYVPKNNDKLVTKARGAISTDIMKAEQTAKTQITDEGVATASELIKHYQAIGQYDKAVEVAQVAAKNLTEAGRTVQAASLYSRISPEGILRTTSARIEKAGGKTLAPDVAERLTKMAQDVQKMPDGPEKLYAVAKLQQEVSSLVPSSFFEKATTLRKAGLLTGLKTQAGNAVSNLSHIGLNKVSDIPAAGVDAMASIFTGKRTKTLTFRGQASGAKEGVQKAAKFLKTGVDELGLATNKYDITPVNFKNKGVQKYVDTVFNTMGAADKPYRYSVFKNQLNDLALAEAKNKGVRGQAARKFIDDFVTDPPPEAAKTAMDYAEKSVFGNDTVLSKVATGIRTSLREKHPAAAAAVDVVAPFTKVPSAVITRLFEYTPVGAVKEAARQIKLGKFDQRAMAQTLGEVSTGTGVLYIGNALASQGQITGPMPTDQKERDLWQLEGKQPNAIRFGDKWYSFNYTSPVGQLLQMGAQIADGSKKGKQAVDALASGVAGGAKAVVDQSFLQGIQGALDALTDPTRYADSFLKSTAGSLIPTLPADIAKAVDPLQRQTNSVQEAVTARIPGLRNTLLPKQDAFGAPLKRQQDAIGTLVDPFRTTKATEGDPLVRELRRLQESNQGVVPNADGGKSIQVGNVKYPLKPEELNRLNTATGQTTQKIWTDTTANAQYGGLADESKKKVLSNIYSDINVVEKYKLLMDGALNDRARGAAAQQMYDKLTKSQMNYLVNGTVDVDGYLAKELPKAPKVALSKAPKAKKARKARGVGGASTPRYRRPKFSTTKVSRGASVKAKRIPKIKFASAPRRGKTIKIKV